MGRGFMSILTRLSSFCQPHQCNDTHICHLQTGKLRFSSADHWSYMPINADILEGFIASSKCRAPAGLSSTHAQLPMNHWSATAVLALASSAMLATVNNNQPAN